MRPHLVKMFAQAGHALRVQGVKPPCSGLCVHYQPCILKHLQVLRNCRPAHRHSAGQLIHGQRAGRELLEDCHPRGIAKGVESGL